MSAETQPTRMVPEAWLDDRTAELATALLANASLTQRLETAEGWAAGYKLALRHILDLLPNEYREPEQQARVMRAWSLVTDGEHQFKPRGGK